MGSDLLQPKDYDMTPACEALAAEGIRFYKPNPYQIKVGPLNYYPSTKRLTLDGGGSEKVSSVNAFIERAKKMGYGPPKRR